MPRHNVFHGTCAPAGFHHRYLSCTASCSQMQTFVKEEMKDRGSWWRDAGRDCKEDGDGYIVDGVGWFLWHEIIAQALKFECGEGGRVWETEEEGEKDMHFLRDLHISSREVPVDGPQAIQRLQEIHVSTREHIVRAGGARSTSKSATTERESARRTGRGGRRMRVINQAKQAEANQHRHDVDDDDGGFEDVNALAIVPVPYRADEQNCEP
nr:hypothetical protein Iba_chr07dCG7910 [Ipomoea batatas]